MTAAAASDSRNDATLCCKVTSMSPDRRTLASFLGNCAGSTAVEFAVLAPILIVLVAGLVDLGQSLYTSMLLRTAARAGAAYAMTNPADTEGARQVVFHSAGMDSTALEVTANRYCECPDGSSVSCSGTCTDGGTISTFVEIKASQRVATVSSYAGLLAPVVLSGKAVFRVR